MKSLKLFTLIIGIINCCQFCSNNAFSTNVTVGRALELPYYSYHSYNKANRYKNWLNSLIKSYNIKKNEEFESKYKNKILYNMATVLGKNKELTNKDELPADIKDVTENLEKSINSLYSNVSTFEHKWFVDLTKLKIELNELERELRNGLEKYGNMKIDDKFIQNKSNKIDDKFAQNKNNKIDNNFISHTNNKRLNTFLQKNISQKFIAMCEKFHTSYNELYNKFIKEDKCIDSLEAFNILREIEIKNNLENYQTKFDKIFNNEYSTKYNWYKKYELLPEDLEDMFIKSFLCEQDFYLFGKLLTNEYKEFMEICKKYINNEETKKSIMSSIEKSIEKSMQNINQKMREIEKKNLKKFIIIKQLFEELKKDINNFTETNINNTEKCTELQEKLQKICNLLNYSGLYMHNDNHVNINTVPGINNSELVEFHNTLENYKRSLLKLQPHQYYNINTTQETESIDDSDSSSADEIN